MLDGNIFFLLKHLAVTAFTAGLFFLFGWWLRGRLSPGRTAPESAGDPEQARKMQDQLDAARLQARSAVQHADELQAELKKLTTTSVPRSDLVAAQNALADERARIAGMNERAQQAKKGPTEEDLAAAEQRAQKAEAAQAELRARHEAALAATAPRHELVAAQNALAEERTRSAELHQRLEHALKAAPSTPAPSPAADPAAAAFGKRVAQDDLKIVEGIGPKIEKILKDAGLKTWSGLGGASIEQIRQILHAAGPRFAPHDPGTWPLQSQMAHEGKWEELKHWQLTHARGQDAKK